METADLRYPIGKVSDQSFGGKEIYDPKIKDDCIREIKQAPGLLEDAILNLDEHQLDTPYRPGGWTVKQVVHHVADSHMNAYMRLKHALTEENPSIKSYNEADWAELYDAKNLPVNISLTLLHALHSRMGQVMEQMTDDQWQRTFYHPEHKRTFKLYEMAATYAWHGLHHTAHITSLRERMKW